MKITSEVRDGICVLTCQGALSIGAGADALDAACAKWIGEGRGIVLDLSRVAYMDSTGLATVAAAARRGAERGSAMKLVLAPDGATRRAFAITELDRILESFEDVESALASFRR